MEKQRYNLLKERYERMTAGREKIDVLIEMTLEVRSTDAEKALEMAEQIIQESEKTGYLAGMGEGLNHKGACYWLMGEYEDGLDELTEA